MGELHGELHMYVTYDVHMFAGAFGYFEVTHDITRYSKAKIFETIGKKTPLVVRYSTVGQSSARLQHHCNVIIHMLLFKS